MAIRLTGNFQWCVRQSAEIENYMTSVERIIEYTRLPSEHVASGDGDGGADHQEPDRSNTASISASTSVLVLPEDPATGVSLPPADWPAKGGVMFCNVALRYDASLPQSLAGVNLTLVPGEKIGVVGRTGAGKSSLLAALFRLSPCIEGVQWLGWRSMKHDEKNDQNTKEGFVFHC